MLKYCNKILAGYIWISKFTSSTQITTNTTLGTLKNIKNTSAVKIFASAYESSKSALILIKNSGSDQYTSIAVDNNYPLPNEVVNNSKGLICSFACIATYVAGS